MPGTGDRGIAERKKPSNVPLGRLDAYERLVTSQPGVERKGASLPYTSVGGHMSSFVDSRGIAMRLGAADRAEFIERFGASLHEAQGTTMKEFVTVPDTLLGDLAQLASWFARSVAYVAGLTPRPRRANRR